MVLYTLLAFTLIVSGCNATEKRHRLNVGTVLFRECDTVKECWSCEDIALLTSKMLLEDVLPKRDVLIIQENAFIMDIIDYFRIILEVVRRLTSGKTKHIMLLALTDTLGGYLYRYVIPTAKQAYYAGFINFESTEKLLELYSELKFFLRTNGHGWARPVTTFSRKMQPQALPRPTPSPRATACKGLMYIDNTVDSSGHKCSITIPMPFFDSKKNPSAIAVPFKTYSLRNIGSKAASYILVKYYTAATKCLMAHKCNHSGMAEFNDDFYSWINIQVLPRLLDDKFYSAFGGILRVDETLKKQGARLSDKKIGNYNIMPETQLQEFGKDTFKEPVAKQRKKSDLILMALLATIFVWFLLGSLFICYRIRAAKSRKDNGSLESKQFREDTPSEGSSKGTMSRPGMASANLRTFGKNTTSSEEEDAPSEKPSKKFVGLVGVPPPNVRTFGKNTTFSSETENGPSKKSKGFSGILGISSRKVDEKSTTSRNTTSSETGFKPTNVSVNQSSKKPGEKPGKKWNTQSDEPSDEQSGKQFNNQSDKQFNKQSDKQFNKQFNKQSDKQFNKQSGKQFNKQSDKQFNKQSDKQFNKQSDKQFNKQSDKQFNKQSDKQFNKQSGKQFNKQSDKQFNKQFNKQPDKQSDKQFNKQSDKQFNKQSDKESKKQSQQSGKDSGSLETVSSSSSETEEPSEISAKEYTAVVGVPCPNFRTFHKHRTSSEREDAPPEESKGFPGRVGIPPPKLAEKSTTSKNTTSSERSPTVSDTGSKPANVPVYQPSKKVGEKPGKNWNKQSDEPSDEQPDKQFNKPPAKQGKKKSKQRAMACAGPCKYGDSAESIASLCSVCSLQESISSSMSGNLTGSCICNVGLVGNLRMASVEDMSLRNNQLVFGYDMETSSTPDSERIDCYCSEEMDNYVTGNMSK